MDRPSSFISDDPRPAFNRHSNIVFGDLDNLLDTNMKWLRSYIDELEIASEGIPLPPRTKHVNNSNTTATATLPSNATEPIQQDKQEEKLEAPTNPSQPSAQTQEQPKTQKHKQQQSLSSLKKQQHINNIIDAENEPPPPTVPAKDRFNKSSATNVLSSTATNTVVSTSMAATSTVTTAPATVTGSNASTIKAPSTIRTPAPGPRQTASQINLPPSPSSHFLSNRTSALGYFGLGGTNTSSSKLSLGHGNQHSSALNTNASLNNNNNSNKESSEHRSKRKSSSLHTEQPAKHSRSDDEQQNHQKEMEDSSNESKVSLEALKHKVESMRNIAVVSDYSIEDQSLEQSSMTPRAANLTVSTSPSQTKENALNDEFEQREQETDEHEKANEKPSKSSSGKVLNPTEITNQDNPHQDEKAQPEKDVLRVQSSPTPSDNENNENETSENNTSSGQGHGSPAQPSFHTATDGDEYQSGQPSSPTPQQRVTSPVPPVPPLPTTAKAEQPKPRSKSKSSDKSSNATDNKKTTADPVPTELPSKTSTTPNGSPTQEARQFWKPSQQEKTLNVSTLQSAPLPTKQQRFSKSQSQRSSNSNNSILQDIYNTTGTNSNNSSTSSKTNMNMNIRSIQLAAAAAKKEKEEKERKQMEKEKRLAVQQKKTAVEQNQPKSDLSRSLNAPTASSAAKVRVAKTPTQSRVAPGTPGGTTSLNTGQISRIAKPLNFTPNTSNAPIGATPSRIGSHAIYRPKVPLHQAANTQPSFQQAQQQPQQQPQQQQRQRQPQQQPQRPPIAEDTVELPNIDSEYSDSDNEESKKKKETFPDWAQSPNLYNALQAQASINPDTLFGSIPTLKMDEIFRGSRSGKRFRSRTSSANWSTTGDGLTREEEVEYARRMGFQEGS